LVQKERACDKMKHSCSNCKKVFDEKDMKLHFHHNARHWFCKQCYKMKKAKEKYHVDIVLDMTPESVDWIKHVKKKK